MRTHILFVLPLLTAMAACTGAPAGPTGPTPAALEEAQGLVRAMQPKAEAMTALEGKLGAPATSDDSGASWFAKDGERCKELRVQIMADMVGNVELKAADCPS